MVVVVPLTVRLPDTVAFPLKVALVAETSPLEVTVPQPTVPTVMFGVPVRP